jgi:chaperone required for assembly of F1-ATPase
VKRFYKQVTVTTDGLILLDGRVVKTPRRAVLTLPTSALAQAVADEWAAQGEDVKPHVMPLTGYASAAIDIVSQSRPAFAASLAAYGETELLCYRAVEPEPLVERQNAVWDPILGWARQRYDVDFTLVEGVMHQRQPPLTLLRLSEAVATHSAFALAALSPIVTISGSLVMALMVAERHIVPEAAFDAAHLDELWQSELWGEDSFAKATRDAHRADFLAACRFLALLGA